MCALTRALPRFFRSSLSFSPQKMHRFSNSDFIVLQFLLKQNMKIATIAKKMNFKKNTILRWKKRIGGPKVIRKPIPTKCSVSIRRRSVEKLVKAHNVVCTRKKKWFVFPNNSCSRIASRVGVSRQTVWRDLKKLKFKSRVRPLISTNSAEDEKKRVAFCKSILSPSFRASDWIFSDETNQDDQQIHLARRQWVRGKKELKGRCTSNYPTKLMFWGAIGIGFKSELVCFDPNEGRKKYPRGRPRKDEKRENFEKSKGMKTDFYVEKCLKPILPFLRKKNFVQDGAKPHIGGRKFLLSKSVLVSSWPARSPDLNPIESLWLFLHQRVALRCPSGREEIKKITIEEWNKIPQKLVDRLVLGFENRLKKCLKSNGKFLSGWKKEQ